MLKICHTLSFVTFSLDPPSNLQPTITSASCDQLNPSGTIFCQFFIWFSLLTPPPRPLEVHVLLCTSGISQLKLIWSQSLSNRSVIVCEKATLLVARCLCFCGGNGNLMGDRQIPQGNIKNTPRCSVSTAQGVGEVTKTRFHLWNPSTPDKHTGNFRKVTKLWTSSVAPPASTNT